MNEIDALEEFFQDVPNGSYFTKRNDSIPGDFRLSWRISLLCLLLVHGRANQLHISHLHSLWWALNSRANRKLFLRWLDGSRAPEEIIIRFDPSVNTAVDFAQGASLITVSAKGVVKLTDLGLRYAGAIKAETRVLREEKSFLEMLPKSITQKQMNLLLDWK